MYESVISGICNQLDRLEREFKSKDEEVKDLEGQIEALNGQIKDMREEKNQAFMDGRREGYEEGYDAALREQEDRY